MSSTSRVRPALNADIAPIVRLVHELAEYERAAQLCHLTEEQLRVALFPEAAEPALFAHVAEVEGQVVGVAIWFLNFSTWDGVHGIHLEDLYVTDEHRGSGLGRELLTTLARVCVERGLTRLVWNVLDWNAPSIAFYESLGAVHQAAWLTYRLDAEALRSVGAS